MRSARKEDPWFSARGKTGPGSPALGPSVRAVVRDDSLTAYEGGPARCPLTAGPNIFNPQDPNLGQLKLLLREYRCTKYDIELVEN